jgi:hypothetical protein
LSGCRFILILVFRSILVPITATAGSLFVPSLATFGGIHATPIPVFGHLAQQRVRVHDPAPNLSFLPVIRGRGAALGLAMDYQLFPLGVRNARGLCPRSLGGVAVQRGVCTPVDLSTRRRDHHDLGLPLLLLSESSVIRPIGFDQPSLRRASDAFIADVAHPGDEMTRLGKIGPVVAEMARTESF